MDATNDPLPMPAATQQPPVYVAIAPPDRNGLSVWRHNDASPATGNMPSRYLVWRGSESPNYRDSEFQERIKFQEGPVGEYGVNGLQHAHLYSILIDRLVEAQKGPFPCKENDEQIKLLCEAAGIDSRRTSRRVEQGVEGTDAPDKEPE